MPSRRSFPTPLLFHGYCAMHMVPQILIPYAMLTVGIGEILAIGVLGNILLVTLERHL